MPILNWTLFITILCGPNIKHPSQQFLYCCLSICYRGNLFTEPLRSNERLLWLNYPGHQTSCNNMDKSYLRSGRINWVKKENTTTKEKHQNSLLIASYKFHTSQAKNATNIETFTLVTHYKKWKLILNYCHGFRLKTTETPTII
jgi:hypothetical protein